MVGLALYYFKSAEYLAALSQHNKSFSQTGRCLNCQNLLCFQLTCKVITHFTSGTCVFLDATVGSQVRWAEDLMVQSLRAAITSVPYPGAMLRVAAITVMWQIPVSLVLLHGWL